MDSWERKNTGANDAEKWAASDDDGKRECSKRCTWPPSAGKEIDGKRYPSVTMVPLWALVHKPPRRLKAGRNQGLCHAVRKYVIHVLASSEGTLRLCVRNPRTPSPTHQFQPYRALASQALSRLIPRRRLGQPLGIHPPASLSEPSRSTAGTIPGLSARALYPPAQQRRRPKRGKAGDR